MKSLGSKSLRAALREERGSAFVLVLMVILVLTFVGLSLAFVTDTEMELGSNVRLMNRSYIAAESGLSAAIAALLASGDWKGERFLINEEQLGNTRVGIRVRTTPLNLIAVANPPWTNANVGERQFISTFVGITSTAQRVGYPATMSAEEVARFDSSSAGVITQTQGVASTAALISPVKRPERPKDTDFAENSNSNN